MSTVRGVRIILILVFFSILNYSLKNHYKENKLQCEKNDKTKGRLHKRSTWYIRSEHCNASTAIIESSNQTCMVGKHLSCKNRCYTIPDTEYLCQCDDKCTTFMDCCSDYVKWCEAGVPQGSVRNKNSTTENVADTGNPNDLVCFQATPSERFYLVRRCPSNTDQHLTRRCEEDKNSFNLLEALPVSDLRSGIHYRNRFCAKCNGANPDDLHTWKLTIYCNTVGQKEVDEIQDELSLALIVNLVTSSTRLGTKFRCEVDYELNSTIHLIAPPRPCFDVVSTCGSCADETLIKLCSAMGMAPVNGYVNRYKNVYCGICHESYFNLNCEIYGEQLSRNVMTSFGLFSLSLLVNVGEDDATQKDVFTTTVKNEGVFNVGDVVYGCTDGITSENCSPVRCPVNFVATAQAKCVLVSSNVDILIIATTFHANKDEANYFLNTFKQHISRIVRRVFTSLIGTIKYVVYQDAKLSEGAILNYIVHHLRFKIILITEKSINETMLIKQKEFKSLMFGGISGEIIFDMAWEVKYPNETLELPKSPAKGLLNDVEHGGNQRRNPPWNITSNCVVPHLTPTLTLVVLVISKIVLF